MDGESSLTARIQVITEGLTVGLELGQQRALDAVKGGKNVFLTGGAGVGKSFVIRRIEEMLGDKCLLLSPTGIAALNIGGVTLHKAFGLGTHILSTEDIFETSRAVTDIFTNESLTTLIIDEISTARADVFYTIDRKLRIIRRDTRPFGGLQVIVVGDYFQFPPVVATSERNIFYKMYDNRYAFSTSSWDECEFEKIELTVIKRQDISEGDNAKAVESFNYIRTNYNPERTISALSYLNSKCCGKDFGNDTIVLATTNKLSNDMNLERYLMLKGKEFLLKGVKSGEYDVTPVDQKIKIKIGCKVILCANNSQQGYFNGSSGIVIDYDAKRGVRVNLDNGNDVWVQRHTWEQKGYDLNDGILTKDVVGSFTQYPIKIGYAITLHKSLGLTLSHVSINTGGFVFEHGQLYTGLTRVRNIANLSLQKPLKYNDVIVDKVVKDFYNRKT